jgi:DNA-binding NarL/FixJ family response regulator
MLDTASSSSVGAKDFTMMERARIVVADDHNLLLDALQKLLSDDFDVVATVADGRSLVREAGRLKPDVAVVDLAMPDLNGLEAARQLKREAPNTRIVFLTMNEDPDLAAEAFRAGASAYVLKRSAAAELVTAIREALQSRSYVTPLITQGLMGSLQQKERKQSTLTTRQREVVKLVAEGNSMKQVADILNIAPRTVAFHKYRIMEQLKIRTTAELIQFAIRSHIV